MSKPALDSFPARYQAQIVAQLHATPKPTTVARPTLVAEPQKKRLRQNATGLNKTEAAFLEWLRAQFPMSEVLSQKVTLLIANGCRYTPDFILCSPAEVAPGEADAVTLWAYEVKGWMRDDAAVKLKVAASLYPWIKFHLVSKGKGGSWNVQEVLP